MHLSHRHSPCSSDSSAPEKRSSRSRAPKHQSFAEAILSKPNEPEKKRARYTLAADAPPTSNVAERLFSSAKNVIDDRRHRLKPERIECLLFLKLNRDCWDVKTVATAMKKSRAPAE